MLDAARKELLDLRRAAAAFAHNSNPMSAGNNADESVTLDNLNAVPGRG
jgi:hypothetical protein